MANLTGLARSLVKHGLLEETLALEVIENARLKHIPLLTFLVEQNIVDATQAAMIMAEDFNLPLLDFDSFDTNFAPQNLIDEKLIKRHQVFPLMKRGGYLFLGIADPTQLDGVNEIRFHTGLNITPILLEADKLRKAVEDLLTGKLSGSKTSSTIEQFDELSNTALDAIDISSDEDLNEDTKGDELAANDAPIVRFINKIILDAINLDASDIHFEPYENLYRIRYRRDGILYEITKPPINLSSRLAARLKVMADLDISERRVPQDGRFKMRLSRNRSVGFRVNTCPTIFGEKIVLRILDPTVASMGVNALGFSDKQRKLFEQAIDRPQGMILVTGPTGSGKTVTQYTALGLLNKPETNISTVEDPVEIYMSGVNQVSVNIKTGLTFATALRSFLRQDPDVIMVGEIRDTETAEIAIKAAQTGHLVLSTLHTNSAAETLTRLVSMGIAPFNIATSVQLVIAQRLVRRLCESCKQVVEIPKEALLDEGLSEEEIVNIKIYGAKGCSRCTKGYKGRMGIYEMMPVTHAIERIIMSNGSSLDIADRAIKEGMMTLRRAGLEKVLQGLTSIEEINRATMD